MPRVLFTTPQHTNVQIVHIYTDNIYTYWFLNSYLQVFAMQLVDSDIHNILFHYSVYIYISSKAAQ